jgi:hypothetical protein
VGGFPYVIANDLAGTTTSYTWRTPNTTQPEVFIVVNPENGQEVMVGPFALQEVLSVGENEDAGFAVSLYPNPAANVLSVNCEGGEIVVSMTDLTGKQVLAQSARGGKLTLDVSTLSSGSYILTVQQGAGSVSKRISIQR